MSSAGTDRDHPDLRACRSRYAHGSPNPDPCIAVETLKLAPCAETTVQVCSAKKSAGRLRLVPQHRWHSFGGGRVDTHLAQCGLPAYSRPATLPKIAILSNDAPGWVVFVLVVGLACSGQVWLGATPVAQADGVSGELLPRGRNDCDSGRSNRRGTPGQSNRILPVHTGTRHWAGPERGLGRLGWRTGGGSQGPERYRTGRSRFSAIIGSDVSGNCGWSFLHPSGRV